MSTDNTIVTNIENAVIGVDYSLEDFVHRVGLNMPYTQYELECLAVTHITETQIPGEKTFTFHLKQGDISVSFGHGTILRVQDYRAPNPSMDTFSHSIEVKGLTEFIVLRPGTNDGDYGEILVIQNQGTQEQKNIHSVITTQCTYRIRKEIDAEVDTISALHFLGMIALSSQSPTGDKIDGNIPDATPIAFRSQQLKAFKIAIQNELSNPR